MVVRLQPMRTAEPGATKPAQRAPKSVKVRFQSNDMFGAPGFVRWIQAMGRFPQERPQAVRLLKATYPGLPAWAYVKIATGQTDSQIVDDSGAVIVTVTR